MYPEKFSHGPRQDRKEGFAGGCQSLKSRQCNVGGNVGVRVWGAREGDGGEPMCRS